jgi:DinB superfamily
VQPRILNPDKALRTLRKTPALLDFVLAGLDEAAACALRDGPDGWSILFIVCHLRDYERVVAARVEAMLADDDPTLPSMDNDALVREGDYAARSLAAVREELRAGRAALLDRLAGLDAARWQRPGYHPQQGAATVLDVAINAGLHDVDHLEQIARCRTGG